MQLKFFKLGSLSSDTARGFYLSSGSKLILSLVAQLFKRPYAKEHGFIDLSCQQISECAGGLFNERAVRRHIFKLKKSGALIEQNALVLKFCSR